jgi:hypothetical protein
MQYRIPEAGEEGRLRQDASTRFWTSDTPVPAAPVLHAYVDISIVSYKGLERLLG